MKLTLSEPTYLKDSIAIISELVNETRFKVNKDGIELIAMDPANVAMVIFKLLSSAFTEYDVQEEMEIAINLTNLKQILKRAKPADNVTLEVTPDNKLQIKLKSRTTRTFSLPIIELEEKEQKVPQLDFPLSIKTKSSILNEAVEDADIVAESVTFMIEDKKFYISAEGDLSKANIEITSGDNTEITCPDDKIKSKYSIEYLKKMISGAKLSDDVSIFFNKDYPLKLEYKTVDKVLLAFILAPRVEND